MSFINRRLEYSNVKATKNISRISKTAFFLLDFEIERDSVLYACFKIIKIFLKDIL